MANCKLLQYFTPTLSLSLLNLSCSRAHLSFEVLSNLSLLCILLYAQQQSNERDIEVLDVL